MVAPCNCATARTRLRPKPAPRGAATGIGAVEALEDPGLEVRGDAGPAVGHRHQDSPARRRHPKLDAPAGGCVLDRVVHQVGQGLEQQVTIPVDPGRSLHCDLQGLTPFPGQGLVEFHQVLGQGGQVEFREAGAGLGRLDPGNAQQGIEGREQLIGLQDGSLQVRGRGGRKAQGIEPGAQPRQGGAQIMGDVVRHLPQTGHEGLDAGEHGVEAQGELVEIVAGAVAGDPATKVPGRRCRGWRA